MTEQDVGRLDIRYDEPIVAGQLVTVVFEYTVGAGGMREGGRLRIGLPSVGWAMPLVPQHYFWSEYAKGKDRTYTQYDRVNTTVCLETKTNTVGFLEAEPRFRKPWTFPPSWLRDYDRYWITVTTEDDGLEPGDRIIVTYGDPDQHPLTARVQALPERKACFLAFVDAEAGGDFHEVKNSPSMVAVLAGPASQLDVIVPSIVLQGEEVRARVAYSDDVKAPPRPAPDVKTLTIRRDGSDDDPREVSVNDATDSVMIEAPELTANGDADRAIRVEVRDGQRGLSAVSNPSLVRTGGRRLFWGDLHGQSQYHGWTPKEKMGISCNTPEECFRYARDIAGLDFCAVTDSRSIANDIWDDAVQSALRMNEPGRFVAFQGSEVGDNVNGHRNLVFAGDEPEPGITPGKVTGRADIVEDLQVLNMQKRYAGRDDVILIPHHTKMWLNWGRQDPELEPVLEIYSIWGSGEKAGTDLWEILREMSGGAQEAWARGYRIGVIAGSDTHAGMPGRSVPASDRDDFMIYKAGYAAVWADELTRGSLFEALKARRCYGTTGARIILEVFLDDSLMGSEVDWADAAQARALTVNVWGDGELDTVTIVKNNEDVRTFQARGDCAEFVWEDKTPAADGDYYYVRVRQRDDNRAWSSPIWLNV